VQLPNELPTEPLDTLANALMEDRALVGTNSSAA
jgi:hypothetical protein